MPTPALPAEFWSHLMDVYTVGAGGDYSVKAASKQACRLSVISTRNAQSAPERAELAALRRLTWGPTYAMPDHAQVEIGGIRWNVAQDTIAAVTWPLTGDVVHYSADIVRSE